MAIAVLPTLKHKLEESVGEVVSGRVPVYSAKSGFCLMVARLCAAAALGFDPEDAWAFHHRYSFSRVPGNESGVAWARSTQRTMRDELGMQVPLAERRVGDWAFNYKIDETFGHVAVVVAVTPSATTILENTASKRGTQHDGFNRLSKLEDWPFLDNVEAMRFQEA